MTSAVRLALAVTGGLLYAAAFPPVDLGWVAFVALVPLLLVTLDPSVTRGRTFLLGWLAGSVATSLLVTTSVATAATRYFELGPTTAWLAGLAAPQLYGAPYFGVFALLARAVARRSGGPVRSALAIAAAWVTCDLLRARLGDGCPWVLLAHSQHAHPTLLQVADLGGASLVAFVVALVNAAIALAITLTLSARRGNAPGRRAPLAALATVVTLIVGATLVYGRIQLARWSAPPGASLRVALVQGNLPDSWRYSLRDQPEALRRMRDLTAQTLAEQPDLVVWPENAISISPDASSSGFAAVTSAMPATARLLIGAPRAVQTAPGRAALYNSALLIDPRGDSTPAYDKLRLTAWAEGPPWPLGALPGLWPRVAGAYTPGQPIALPEIRGHRFGVAICSEAIYAELIAAQVRRGATFLVNMANDGWFGDRPAGAQHAAAVALRAVESRRFLVRVTSTGVSMVVAPSGVVGATIPNASAGSLVATVTPLDATTLYTRIGDVFAWLCVLAVAVTFVRPRRSAPA